MTIKTLILGLTLTLVVVAATQVVQVESNPVPVAKPEPQRNTILGEIIRNDILDTIINAPRIIEGAQQGAGGRP
ncbi:hypothetical protein HK102_005695 [Quaeritorhiza haematococci]|nr:hypothetical protein HK102_005695 [Quaeritorhiza haematococci]